MRVGNKFNDMKNSMKSELSSIHNRKITDKMLTDELAIFIQHENLDKFMMRRAKRKRGLF